jgi:hypothetical protein
MAIDVLEGTCDVAFDGTRASHSNRATGQLRYRERVSVPPPAEP